MSKTVLTKILPSAAKFCKQEADEQFYGYSYTWCRIQKFGWNKPGLVLALSLVITGHNDKRVCYFFHKFAETQLYQF